LGIIQAGAGGVLANAGGSRWGRGHAGGSDGFASALFEAWRRNVRPCQRTRNPSGDDQAQEETDACHRKHKQSKARAGFRRQIPHSDFSGQTAVGTGRTSCGVAGAQGSPKNLRHPSPRRRLVPLATKAQPA
jgi:hypothetical protein